MKNGTTYLTPGLKVVCLFTRCVLGDSLPQGVSGANRLPVTVDGWAPPHEQDSLLSLSVANGQYNIKTAPNSG